MDEFVGVALRVLTLAFVLTAIASGVALLRRSVSCRANPPNVRIKDGIIGLLSVLIGIAGVILNRL